MHTIKSKKMLSIAASVAVLATLSSCSYLPEQKSPVSLAKHVAPAVPRIDAVSETKEEIPAEADDASVVETYNPISDNTESQVPPQPDPAIVVGHVAFGSTSAQQIVDRCDGTFTAVLSDIGRVVFAAHNSCNGSIVLNLSIGQIITITGGGFDGAYRVVDELIVPQGSLFTAFIGLGGNEILQTCFFHDANLRLLGLERI